jgi:hypothetical protein
MAQESPAVKAAPVVTKNGNSVTIAGSGPPDEPVRLVITNTVTNVDVVDESDKLNGEGEGSFTVTLPNGSYTATVTDTNSGAQKSVNFDVP